tara:strand:- start:2471 stop:2950 length:480 start_codon:yes stop_codon:yes gene_type:complete
MENNPNKIKNGGKGTLVGNAIRFLTDQGKAISPVILEVASKITGLDSLDRLGDLIAGDESLAGEDKELLLKQIELDIVVEQEITKRWEADSNSKDWLPRNIRPLVVANFTILIDIVVLSSMWGQPLGEAYLPLLMTMGITAIGGYFSLREYGKAQVLKN